MEHVRLCRFCGHINPVEEMARCERCQSFSGLITVPRAHGEQLARRKRQGFWRSKIIRFLLLLAPVTGLAFWASWSFLGLAPDPPGATTELGAGVEPQTWAQARRTPQNTGFTPEPAPVPESVIWTYASTKPIMSAPAVADGQVFLATEDGRTVALNSRTGQPMWEYHSGFPSNSVPAVAGDLVFFTLRPGFIIALDRQTGTSRWSKKIEDPVLASPVVADGKLYVGAADSNLYVLDAATGEELWRFAANDWITSEVALEGGLVVTTSQSSLVQAISTKTGRRRLVYDTGRGRNIRGGPAVQGGVIYFGSNVGRVWAVDLHSRTRPWDRPVLFWQTNLYV